MKQLSQNGNSSNNITIPMDWKISTVGEAFKICNNLRFPISEEERSKIKGEYPYYGPTKIQDYINEFRVEGKYALIGEDGDHFLKWKELPMTLLVEGKFNVNNHAHIIQGDKNLTEWFFYFFNNRELTPHLTRQGAGRYKLTKDALSKMLLPLPPLPEQKAIAHILGLMDTAINQNNQLIAQKELRKKWLMQNLLTGKKRLKGFSGEWKKEKLEKYLIKHDEKSTSSKQYPVLTSSRKGIFLQSDYYTRDVASEDNTGYNVVPRGYFTYRHMSDDLIFKFNINDIVDRGIVSTLYPVFTVNGINQYFLLCKLNEGNEFKIHAQEQKQGGSRTYVYFKTLCELKLNLPNIQEQTAIAQLLQAADKEIQLLKTKTEKLRLQKKGMMQVLLTGKKRLKIE